MWLLILLEHFVVGRALSLNLFLFNTVHFLEDAILNRQDSALTLGNLS